MLEKKLNILPIKVRIRHTKLHQPLVVKVVLEKKPSITPPPRATMTRTVSYQGFHPLLRFFKKLENICPGIIHIWFFVRKIYLRLDPRLGSEKCLSVQRLRKVEQEIAPIFESFVQGPRDYFRTIVNRSRHLRTFILSSKLSKENPCSLLKIQFIHFSEPLVKCQSLF